jgi:hypothetical protein
VSFEDEVPAKTVDVDKYGGSARVGERDVDERERGGADDRRVLSARQIAGVERAGGVSFTERGSYEEAADDQARPALAVLVVSARGVVGSGVRVMTQRVRPKLTVVSFLRTLCRLNSTNCGGTHVSVREQAAMWDTRGCLTHWSTQNERH